MRAGRQCFGMSWMVPVVGAALLLIAIVVRSEEYAAPSSEPAIEGYSPVSYFTAGQAERGNPEYAVTHDGETYFLTSERQVEQFSADPDRYVPAYGEYCPYNLALGRHVAIDPTNFAIVGDQLLLFHRSGEMDGREAFEAQDRQQELLDRARREFVLMKF